MRNVFDQYEQPENRLTHALVCALGEDGRLLRRFVRWATSAPAPKGRLHIVEQQRPGEATRAEEDAVGLPDVWIYNQEGWSLLVESKITAEISVDQLRRHLATAARHGFQQARLMILTAREEDLQMRRNLITRGWTDVYAWLLHERRRSRWAARCAGYMEILEADLIQQGKLEEGGVTMFSGVPFDPLNPYNYLEAKRLLKLAMDKLRGNAKQLASLA